MATEAITIEDYKAFSIFLEDASGIVLGDNKQYLVTSRLTRLMADNDILNFSNLMSRMKSDAKLRQRIMDAMTTNETSWFRDIYPFDILKEKLLPEFSKKKSSQVRIWSAACSTGQEPYSLSMMAHEYHMGNPGRLPANAVQIIGTDISPRVLDAAKAGIYEGIAVSRGLSQDRQSRFFRDTKDGGWEVSKDIKQRVSFREINLMQNYALMGRFDIIYCRNVLIYFSTELKRDILSRMAKCLNPGGYLVLGGSESISNYSDEFELIRWRNGVIYQIKQ